MAIVSDAQCNHDGCERVVQAKWTGLCRNHHREHLANLSRVGVKPCSRCGETKPLSDFGARPHRKTLDGGSVFKSKCRACESAEAAEWRARNPGYGKRWYRENREKHLAYSRYQKYGILPDRLESMIAEQDGKCAVCSGALDRPQVDHDHVSGAVRGILCPNCNMALGLLQDSPDVIRSAALYLERHKN